MFEIDNEFKNLIPPLSNEEFNQLEANILRDGIREPLAVWKGILIDGHNRYTIAQKHNLPFTVAELNFDNRADVIMWIIQNQFGRRNISTFDRIGLALKLKPVIAAKAKQNQIINLKQNGLPFNQKKSNGESSGESIDTLKVIANMAGVSRETARKVAKILELAQVLNLEDIMHGLKTGEVSISLAFEAAHYRKQKLDDHTEKIKNHLQNLKENWKQFKFHYQAFLARYDQMTPTEQKNFEQEKSMLDKIFNRGRELGIEEMCTA